MGVYIPNWNKPKSCDECWAEYAYEICNSHSGICPLVPVRQHGRLIDADALYEDCALDRGYEVMATTTRINEYMQLKIDGAPTIIQASE